ncbi:RHS repeat-associated core domain-containing protein, partial [Dickeya oryzae]|uniref:RHS repeat-associated core domain-containing protein n=1 Tax=Dickeya oryzae TaxID=1240404 RepID=UPI00316692AC
ARVAYRWDGDQLSGQTQYRADGSVARAVQWVYEPGSFRPLAQVEEKDERTQLHYIVTDLTGTARELCSETGEVHWRGEQGLWGAHREEKIPIPLRRWLGDAANEEVYCELRYQGQVYDSETGLYYNRHRYYDPTLGQYISADPIGIAGGIRPQAYVHNPLEWIDPLGLSGCPDSDDPKADRKRRHHSKSAEYEKHTKAKTKEDAIKLSSNKGPSQYWDESVQGTTTSKDATAFRNKIEKEALKNGKYVPQSGGSDYYIYDAGKTVGYNGGKPTQYMRVEVTKSTNEFHGHPISPEKYFDYLGK